MFFDVPSTGHSLIDEVSNTYWHSFLAPPGTEQDVELLQDSGNDFCNCFFEAKLSDKLFEKSLVLGNAQEEEHRRANFIKKKYKKLKYFDEVVYHKEVLNLIQRRRREQQDEEERRRSATVRDRNHRSSSRRDKKSHRDRSRSRSGRSSQRSSRHTRSSVCDSDSCHQSTSSSVDLYSQSQDSQSIESAFLSSIGLSSKPRVDPFLSENDECARRRVYAIPDPERESDNEAVAIPLRKRLSDRSLGLNAVGDPHGQGPQTRLERRLSNRKLIAPTVPVEEVQPRVRRRRSDRQLLTSTAPAESSDGQPRRRLSTRKLNPKSPTADQPAGDQSGVCRKLSNRSIAIKPPPDAAAVGQKELRRSMSSTNLSVNASTPIDGHLLVSSPPVRRRLSNRNLMAIAQQGESQDGCIRRRGSTRNLMGTIFPAEQIAAH